MYLNDSCESLPMSLESDTIDTEIMTSEMTENPARNAGSKNGLRSIEEISPKFRHIFQYPYFNQMQSQLIDDALYSDKSMVISAPTGSGKTAIFEIAIVRLIQQLEMFKPKNDFKIIYMAPMRALCTERLTDWYGKFSKLGLPCIEVTGDSEMLDFNHLKSYKMIMTTPEKWDAITRRWKDNKEIVQVVKLFIIDEVHLLNEDVRGPVLEAVVSRMKTIQESLQSSINVKNNKATSENNSAKQNVSINIRFIAASATIPNAEDVAEWLGTKENPAVCYKIGEEYRPVKLIKIVEGYTCRNGVGLFKFDLSLNYKLRLIIERYCDGKPTLIFCNTRKSVMLAAETLSRELLFHFTHGQTSKFTQMASQLSDKKLQKLLIAGIGCHHAGFMQKDRNIMEQIFREGSLPVLITTSTLATGVNLPAHLVIIKTTQHYINGAYTEYDESSILQMMGRAGRPQFDNEGVAVIMTRLQDKERYEKLCSGQRAVESKLHRHLAEHLNAEVALGTLPDLLLAMDWLRSTFLYVRATRNPSHYGCSKIAGREIIEKKLHEICIKWMNALARVGLLTMDADARVFPTEAGILMATYCLDFDTMKLILKLRGTEDLNELVTLVSECHEFEDIPLRASEKRCLNLLNKNMNHPHCRFSMAGKIKTKSMKANCLIQAALGNLPILDSSLYQESIRIVKTGENITKCIVAYLSHSNKSVYRALLSAITLAKCFNAKMWENSDYVLRQLTGIGPALVSLLVAADKTSFEKIRTNNPRDLERILNKGPPAGNILKKQVTLIPIYALNLKREPEDCVDAKISIVNYSDIQLNGSTTGNSHKLSLIVGDSENNLLYYSIILDIHILNMANATITKRFKIKCSTPHTVYAHCISTTWVGLDVCSTIEINKLHTSKNNLNTTHITNNSNDYDDVIESSQLTCDDRMNRNIIKCNPTPSAKKTVPKKTSTNLEEQINTIINKIKPCCDIELPCDKILNKTVTNYKINKNNATTHSTVLNKTSLTKNVFDEHSPLTKVTSNTDDLEYEDILSNREDMMIIDNLMQSEKSQNIYENEKTEISEENIIDSATANIPNKKSIAISNRLKQSSVTNTIPKYTMDVCVDIDSVIPTDNCENAYTNEDSDNNTIDSVTAVNLNNAQINEPIRIHDKLKQLTVKNTVSKDIMYKNQSTDICNDKYNTNYINSEKITNNKTFSSSDKMIRKYDQGNISELVPKVLNIEYSNSIQNNNIHVFNTSNVKNLICLLDKNNSKVQSRERTFKLVFALSNNQSTDNIKGSFSSIDCKLLHRNQCKDFKQKLYSYAYQNIAKIKFEFNLFDLIKKYLINKKIKKPMEIYSEMKRKIMNKKKIMRSVTWRDPLINNNENINTSTKINSDIKSSIIYKNVVEEGNTSFNTNSCKIDDIVSELNLTISNSEKWRDPSANDYLRELSNTKQIQVEKESKAAFNAVYKYNDVLQWIRTSPFECVDDLYTFKQIQPIRDRLHGMQLHQKIYPVVSKNKKPTATITTEMEISETLKKHRNVLKNSMKYKIVPDASPSKLYDFEDYFTQFQDSIKNPAIKTLWEKSLPIPETLPQSGERYTANYQNQDYYEEPLNYQYDECDDKSIANCDSGKLDNENILDPQWVLKNAYNNHRDTYNAYTNLYDRKPKLSSAKIRNTNIFPYLDFDTNRNRRLFDPTSVYYNDLNTIHDNEPGINNYRRFNPFNYESMFNNSQMSNHNPFPYYNDEHHSVNIFSKKSTDPQVNRDNKQIIEKIDVNYLKRFENTDSKRKMLPKRHYF